MKRIYIVFSMLFSALLLVACGIKGRLDTVSKELGIDVSGGAEIYYSNDHGGFHGDGTAFSIFKFEDAKVLEQIRGSSEWKAFPLDDVTEAIVYGLSDETNHSQTGPYLTDDEGEVLAPEIKNGYFILIDRQEGENKTAGADILYRPSLNFTLGIYDTDTDRLYFFRKDT